MASDKFLIPAIKTTTEVAVLYFTDADPEVYTDLAKAKENARELQDYIDRKVSRGGKFAERFSKVTVSLKKETRVSYEPTEDAQGEWENCMELQAASPDLGQFDWKVVEEKFEELK